MASYHARQRDPLLDRKTQAMVEKRSKEVLGLALALVGLAFMAMLGSYSSDDPGWMVATDEPARNMLGRAGAAVSSTLIIIFGLGAWALPAICVVWGGRLILHRGTDRAVSRLIFAWVFLIAASAYASTHVPGATWVHSFGLGGLLGDTILGALLGILPMSASLGLKLASILLMGVMLVTAAFTMGFVREELRSIGRFLFIGTVLLYSNAVLALQKLGLKSAQGASGLNSRLRARAEMRRAPTMAEEELFDDEDIEDAPPQRLRADPPMPEALPPRGLRGRVENLIRRQPEPELVDPEPLESGLVAPSEERIRTRISDAIEAKARKARTIGRVEPPVVQSPARAGAPVMPAVSRAVAAAQARVAAAQAPMRIAVAPASAFAETDYPAAPPAQFVRSVTSAAPPAAVAAPPEGPRVIARTASVARGPQAPMIQTDYETANYDDYLQAQGYEDDLEPHRDTAMQAAVHEDLQGWEEEPLTTATQQIAAAHSYMEAAEDDEDDGFAAWQQAQTPAPAVIRSAPPVQAPRAPAAPMMRAAAPVAPPPRPQAMPSAPQVHGASLPEHGEYEPPPLSLLTHPSTIERHHLSDEQLEENARMLENVLDDYGVKGEIVSVRPGPVVTMYELEPAPGLKASRVIGLADDIARSMSALSARVSTVPGRTVIGIELPNQWREKVVLREIIAARDFGDSNMRLPLALGKDIGGEPIIANLAKMPHLLIAGTTGSGKSVAINTMILSLLYKLTPEECRLIMIDPKMLELSVYDGIPHLLSPVVTDPKKAVVALKWVVGEMEERYRKMSKMGVRNIEGYNGRVREALAKGELFKRTIQTGFDEDSGDPVFETEEFEPQPFPYIVVIVDEMADLMMVAGKEIEACIQRLAQMARASGIHLIMATQRPSVDVITGTIKANFPTRISFQVTSKIDSRTILGEMGAEQLLGMGDMLYMAGGGRISRIHGPFVSDEEVEEIVNHLKSFGPPSYMSGVVDGPEEGRADDIDAVLGLGGGENSEDALYDQAVAIVARDRKCSTSYIQRKLGIGYQKAARLVEQMEDNGVVSTANHVGKREILLPEH